MRRMQIALQEVWDHTDCFDLEHLQVRHSEGLADGPQQGEDDVGLQLHGPKQLRH